MSERKVICAGRGSRTRKRPAHLSDYVLDEDLREPLEKSPRYESSVASEITADAEENDDFASSVASEAGTSQDTELDAPEQPIDDLHRFPSANSSTDLELQMAPDPEAITQASTAMEEQMKLLTEAITSMRSTFDSKIDTLQKQLETVQDKVDNAPRQISQSTQQNGVATDLQPNAVVVERTNSSISSGSNCSRGHKLIDLPVFSGDFKDWPNFISEFDDTTASEGYSTLQNNSRLKKCLTGHAREVVDSMLIHHGNVPQVIEKLRTRFGRPEKITRAQLDIVKAVAPISENKMELLVPFADKVNNMKNVLQSCGSGHHLNNPTLLEELIMKLPFSRKFDWVQHQGTLTSVPSIEDFSDWLNKVADLIDIIPAPATIQKPIHEKKGGRVLLVNAGDRSSTTCFVCQKSHSTEDCADYLKMDLEGRWKVVTDEKLCFNCLREGHRTFRCTKKHCGLNGCKRRHHKTLHKTELNVKAAPFDPRQPPPPVTANGRVCMSTNHDDESNVLYKILPITLYGPKGGRRTFALLDEGSSLTLVNREIADEIGLKGEKQSISIKGIDNEAKVHEAEVVDARISGTQREAKIYDINNVRIVRDLDLPQQTIDFKKLYNNFEHLQNIPIEDFSGAPQVLIGLQHAHLGAPTHVPLYSGKGPIMISTKLGYLLYGPRGDVDDCMRTEIQRVLFGELKPCFEELHDMVRRHYEIEDFGVRSVQQVESQEDRRALEILESTTRRIDGRFESGLIWNSDDIVLPNSYNMAVKRLRTVERKISKGEPYGNMYRQTISNYIEKGYARKLTSEEASKISPRTWYLPHFGVVNPNKPDKFRLVFDAAAMIHGTSLNSALLPGPDLNQPLMKILLRFREQEVGVCGDIREMYHQVKIIKADQDSQRFLWRDQPNQQIEQYVMDSMTFGSASSPTTAQFVKNRNALEMVHQYPEAAKEVIESHYVDDYVCCFPDEETAIKTTQDVIAIHRKGGFELRNFISNSRKVAASLNGSEKSLDSINMEIDSDGTSEKVLGLYWKVDLDSFVFQLKFSRIAEDILNFRRAPTKRELLSIAMSIYDPFGFISNVTIHIKVLVQKLWKTGISWDECLPDRINAEWRSWFTELHKVKDYSIPRCYSSQMFQAHRIELHTLVDASGVAFSAVCYLRIVHEGGVDVAFVAGKTKCAPLKELSIPRLELQAAVLGTRLRNSITEIQTFAIQKCYFWSDSMTVLFWLKDRKCRFKQFVRNRVSEILDTTLETDWFYVSSAENAADDATRDKYPPKFDCENRWLVGPDWLLDERKWPKQPAQLAKGDDDCELVMDQQSHRVLLLHVSSLFFDIKDFSDYMKLKRRLAWYLRFIAYLRAKAQRQEYTKGELLVSELKAAEGILCRQAQMEGFADDYANLKANGQKKVRNELCNLMPYLDEQSVMRVYGRIDNAPTIPIFTKRPIILPKEHHLSFLIVKHFHEIHQHQLDELTLCEVRLRFWIISARTVLKMVKSKCSECIIRSATPSQPMMGQLPMDRLTPYVRPFSYTGVDYFGPVHIAIGRRREKRWVALFTCMTIRAVHLEISENLSSDSFILCLRNFVNLRGLPVQLRSDNGTNFVGAKGEMIRSSTFFGDACIRAECSKTGIDWKFNTPGDPSAGGVWERLVQTVKRVLKPLLKDVTPRTETLRSFLLEAANIVNSRPLTHLPLSCEDENPLTPNSFLLGCPNSIQTVGPTDEKLWCLRKQWRISQGLKNHFWKRFILEYLPTLTRREKWCIRTEPLKVGDLVLICDDDVARSNWSKGRLEEVIAAKDGQVRSAVIRTADGKKLRRPASRLAVLDIQGRSSKDHDESTGGGMSPTGCRHR